MWIKQKQMLEIRQIFRKEKVVAIWVKFLLFHNLLRNFHDALFSHQSQPALDRTYAGIY